MRFKQLQNLFYRYVVRQKSSEVECCSHTADWRTRARRLERLTVVTCRSSEWRLITVADERMPMLHTDTSITTRGRSTFVSRTCTTNNKWTVNVNVNITLYGA